MQSTIIRHDDGKPAVVVEKATEINRDLRIPTRKQARTMIKKRAILVVTFTDEEGEAWDYLVKPMSPMEAANAFGSAFGKSAIEASRKLAEGESTRDEAAEQVLSDLRDRIEAEEEINPVEEFKNKVHRTLDTNVVAPEDLTPEDIEEMDFALKMDLFGAIMGGITGSGDSVDAFSTVDNESEESTRSDDN